ncbi:MAG: adenylate/guanylate cyclase domain-containing protein, partial [Planctomycetia bacterium]|nr:adenylate/guanylate cyclase domain-containing protein [Planctomycetia bacterium]
MGDNGIDAVAYLPASLVQAVAHHPARDLPWCYEVEGTMVMADLSGFTTLSEQLARVGDEGAERLVAIINSFFDRMLKTAGRYGGDTLTFGGDAILLLFDGPDHAIRAAVAALEMLRQVERAAAVETDDGKIKIGMSVGAHSDRFVLVGAGLADERAHLVVLGHGGERTALAEAQADRGQLAVSTACKELLPTGSRFHMAGDFWLVDELGACPLPQLSFEYPRVSDDQLRLLAPFLPPYARGVSPEQGELLQFAPEHRRTVIVFVDILGLTEIVDHSGIDAAVEQLQVYTAMLTGLAGKHSGFVVSSDVATKGSKLVVTFGAPV